MRSILPGIIIMILLFSVIIITISAEGVMLKKTYPTEILPGKSSAVFSPGFLSTGLNERDFAMHPEMDRILYTIMSQGYSVICETVKSNGTWTKPEVVSFSGNPLYYDAEPQFTPDGKQVYFLSTRPLEGDEYHEGWGYEHIWVSELKGDAWSEPRPADMEFEPGKAYFYPSFTRDGDMYLTMGEEESRRSVLCVSRLKDGRFLKPVSLGDNVNSSPTQYNGCVDPQGKFILFCAAGRKDSINRADFYVCFNDDEKGWSLPLNMGGEFNFKGSSAQSISLSPDGKYIIFAARKRAGKIEEHGITYALLDQRHNSFSNGFSNLYWIESSVLEELKANAVW